MISSSFLSKPYLLSVPDLRFNRNSTDPLILIHWCLKHIDFTLSVCDWNWVIYRRVTTRKCYPIFEDFFFYIPIRIWAQFTCFWVVYYTYIIMSTYINFTVTLRFTFYLLPPAVGCRPTECGLLLSTHTKSLCTTES